MATTGGILCRAILLLMALSAATLLFAFSAAAQTSGGASGKAMPPPAGWQEKWVGLYTGQDREGMIAPPGFKVVLPPEPDMLELVVEISQPWARMRHDASNFELEDGGQICRPTGPVRAGSNGAFELLAAPEKITVIPMGGGGIHTGSIRRIYMNRPHLKNPPLTYRGDSVGHWEGDTLVMDVIGMRENTWLTRDRGRHSEALHIVERWRLVANGEWMEKTITVDDRFAYTRPFTMTRYHQRRPLDTIVPENICQDTPESRRAWVKLYKRYLRDWEEERKNLGADGKLTEVQ